MIHQLTRYQCPLCILSTWNKDEEYEGEALKHIKDHLRSWHKSTSHDDMIKIEVLS